MRALFLTWDGPDQTYLESLFFPIFAGLRASGIDVHVMQFTWASEDKLGATRQAAAAWGIPYVSQRVSRSLGALGAMASIAKGASAVAEYASERRIDALFPRSLMPASMTLLAARRGRARRIVFDADGLMADERVDFVGWSPRGAQYRVLREVEAQTTRLSSSVIVRTSQAKSILVARAGAGTDPDKIFVIPNAKDARLFQPGTAAERASVRNERGVSSEAPWLVYAGSLGPQYRLESMLDLFMAVTRRAPAARFHTFTFQEQFCREVMERRGIASESIRVCRAQPAEVAACLGAADLGLAFRAETFSQRAISPIKVGEYLLCGLPVVTTRVGDLQVQIGDKNVGFLIDDEPSPAIEAAASWFVESVLGDRQGFRERCRHVGSEVFGLDRCVERYRLAFEHAALPTIASEGQLG